MRIKTFAKGGYIDGGFTSGGGTMTGPLILAGDPTKDLESVTKQYADSKLANFNADKFISGTLQVGRLPSFTGDVTSVSGSNNISLAPSGVTAGIYTKATVNAKGLITGGGSLSESDIPSLDWTKINAGKPTTIAGYGITDGLLKTGGTISGALTLHADPTAPLHAATKQYIDNISSGASSLKTGDIVYKSTEVTPTGFLRCNGGELSKTVYSALYAVVGDGFSYGTQAGSGKPWCQLFGISSHNSGLTFSANVTTGTGVSTGKVLVTKNKVYIIGGYRNSTYNGQMYSASIDGSGNIGSFAADGTCPAYQYHDIVVTKNKVYLIGGYNGSGSSKTWYATIDANGNIGTWTQGTNLSATGAYPQVITTKNRVYHVSGEGKGINVYVSTFSSSDGILGAWSYAGQLPVDINHTGLVVVKNRLYIIGGRLGGSSPLNTTYYCMINDSGVLDFNWQPGPNLPQAIQDPVICVTNNKVYFMGGRDSSYASSMVVYTAIINPDASLGSWISEGTIPAASSADVFATLGKLYATDGNNISNVAFTGGLNDYSGYHDGTITSVSPTNFRLPDLTSSDTVGAYSYIKT